jgi:hypothetical protein
MDAYMQNPLILLMMFLSAVIVGTLIGAAAMMFWQSRRSRLFRTEHQIPNLLGKWRCQWFDDAQGGDQPKVEDTIDIRKWTANGEFIGQGHQPQFHLSYPIVGEIDPARVVTLVYKAARYPFEPNHGVVCLELSRDGETMEGRWFGRRFSNHLGGGRVKCERILEPATAILAEVSS